MFESSTAVWKFATWSRWHFALEKEKEFKFAFIKLVAEARM